MSNINPFILTGMMPLSASSMNRVSYMCPVTISNDVVQGQTDIQDSLTVDPAEIFTSSTLLFTWAAPTSRTTGTAPPTSSSGTEVP